MRVRMIASILLLCISILVLGCLSKEQREAAKMPRTPEVSNWRDNETILTVKEVEEVPGLGIGRVIIKRASDPSIYYAAVVAPFWNVPVGTEVKVSKLVWQINRVQVTSLSSELLVVRRK